MNRKRGLKLVVLATVVLLAAASTPTWRAVAAPPGVEPAGGVGGVSTEKVDAPAPQAPVPGGPGFYSESAFMFRPYVAGSGYAYNVEELYNPGTTAQAYEAPVSLPNGATITRFVVYYYDNVVADLSALMARIPLDGSGPVEMASVYPTGQPGYTYAEATSIVNPVIDRQSYAYVVQVTLPPNSNVRLVSIRIDYGYGTDLPLITKNP